MKPLHEMAQVKDLVAEIRPVRYQYLTFSTELPRPPKETNPGTPPYPSLSKYDDPQGWSKRVKTFVTWLSCLATFVTTYTPGAYAAGLPQYEAEWGISSTAVYGGITLFTLLFATAPMFLASLSELTGRRPLFLAAGVVFVVSQIGSGVTASFAGMLVTRALAGISCSVFSTVVGGVISDIYAAEQRNTAMAIFAGAALSGTGVGPMISGVITYHLSWRWIYYVQTISCGLMLAALFFWFPETRGSVLLSRKARALNAWYDQVDEGSGVRWRVKADEERASLAITLRTSIIRPIHLLVTESVVFWFSLWMSFAWSILYFTFELVPFMMSKAYGFSTQASGLTFIPVILASVIGSVAAVWQVRLPYVSKTRLHGQPEARLFFACGQSLLLPIGLFWLGATARPDVPWIVPVISLGFITLGIFSVYLAVFNYFADVYSTYASSAIAAQSFTRNVVAACLPLAMEPMFNALGFVGTGCTLGGIGLGLSAVPWVLVLWGPRIRKRSPIASLIPI
jgi:MFS family permease